MHRDSGLCATWFSRSFLLSGPFHVRNHMSQSFTKNPKWAPSTKVPLRSFIKYKGSPLWKCLHVASLDNHDKFIKPCKAHWDWDHRILEAIPACHSITPKVLALPRSTTAIPLIGPATSTKSLLSIEPVHFTQRNLDTATAESNGLTGDVKIARWWYKALTHCNADHRYPLELLGTSSTVVWCPVLPPVYMACMASGEINDQQRMRKNFHGIPRL